MTTSRSEQTDEHGAGETMWVVLPFHPALKPILATRVIKYLHSEDVQTDLLRIFGTRMRFRISWANRMPAHASIVDSARNL